MLAQPIYDAYQSIRETLDYKPRLIYMSPQGRVLDQKTVEELSDYKHLVLLCGHYEGIDQRIIDTYVSDEISIGDYVLSSGEVAAMVFIDCVARLREGVIKPDSLVEESFSNGLLEYPQYTRPEVFRNQRVPEVLVSGNHEKIRTWRLKESLRKTLRVRPDLMKHVKMTEEVSDLLGEIMEEGKNGPD